MFKTFKIVTVLTALVMAAGVNAENIIGVITASKLNVRVQPNTSTTTVASLPKGTRVTILGQVENWYKIIAPRTAEVWISRPFIEGDTIIKRVNLRSGPSVAYHKYVTVDPGLKVGVIDGSSNPDWVRIVPPKGINAYVSADYVEVIPSKSVAVKKVKAPVKKAEIKKPIIVTTKKPVVVKPKQTTVVIPPRMSVKPKTTTVVMPPNKELSAATKAEKVEKKDDQDAKLVKDIVKTVTVQGILLPLIKNNSLATHSIAVKVENQYYPLCYVYTDRYNLSLWENRRIMVKGEQYWVKGWQKPLVKAERITPMWK